MDFLVDYFLDRVFAVDFPFAVRLPERAGDDHFFIFVRRLRRVIPKSRAARD